RQAKRRLDLFRNVGIDSRIVSVVVNRIERRLFGTISLADVAHALGQEVLVGLHVDAQNIGIAQDQGLLVSEVRAKSPYAADVAKLADMLAPRLTETGQLRGGNYQAGSRARPTPRSRRAGPCHLSTRPKSRSTSFSRSRR